MNIIKISNKLLKMQCQRGCVLTKYRNKVSNAPTTNQAALKQSSNDEDDTVTHFGFKTVKANEKGEMVHKLFKDSARTYDYMNDIMSVGMHRLWKDIFMERLDPRHGTRLLDMAGGTGDIAFRYLKYIRNQPNPKGLKSHVIVSDINQHMLDVGERKAKQLGLINGKLHNISIDWKCADAENLCFEDNTFNAYTIAFGMRNVTHMNKVLREAYRVLQPAGRFMCLEFSQLTNEPMQWLYDQYSFKVLPPMGHMLTGKRYPYQYLVESIRKFPNQEHFKKMIIDAGFNMVQYENLTFGMVSIHSGFKL